MNGANVKVYSRAKDGNVALSRNFKVREFACCDGTDTVFVSPELVAVLQKIRDHFGKAVNINSGYRTEAHNKKVGGAAYSQHKYGGQGRHRDLQQLHPRGRPAGEVPLEGLSPPKRGKL